MSSHLLHCFWPRPCDFRGLGRGIAVLLVAAAVVSCDQDAPTPSSTGALDPKTESLHKVLGTLRAFLRNNAHMLESEYTNPLPSEATLASDPRAIAPNAWIVGEWRISLSSVGAVARTGRFRATYSSEELIITMERDGDNYAVIEWHVERFHGTS